MAAIDQKLIDRINVLAKKKKEGTISEELFVMEIRISKGMGQTELVRKIQLRGITMTRETLVKIERGVQHIYATQLKAIKVVDEKGNDITPLKLKQEKLKN